MAKKKLAISLTPELYDKLKARAAKQGVSFSYIVECCAAVGLNVLEGKDTKQAVEQAVAYQLGPMLRMLSDVAQDLELPTLEEQQRRFDEKHHTTKK